VINKKLFLLKNLSLLSEKLIISIFGINHYVMKIS